MKGSVMTDAPASSQSAANVTAPDESSTLPPQVFTDPMHEMQFKMFEEKILERNALVAKVNAAAGNKEELLNHFRENDNSDPEIVAAREAYAQAYLNLMALVEPKVDAIVADSKGSQEETEKQIGELDGILKPGLNYFKKLYGEKAAEYFTKQERLKGVNIRSGAGVRRLRNLMVTITLDDEAISFENFSTAAKHLGWDTTDLQKAFFDKAGTEDPKKFPQEVVFVVNFDEVDKEGKKEEKSATVKVERTDVEDSSNDEDATSDSSEDEVIEDGGAPDEGDLSNLI